MGDFTGTEMLKDRALKDVPDVQPLNNAGYWGDMLREASSILLLGDSTTEWADGVEGVSRMESYCLAVVPRGTFPEVSPEESSLDISPLNSYRGESIQSDQLEWVRQNMEVFSKQMGVSIEGCEIEAMALFMAIKQRWRQTGGGSRTIVCTN